MPALEAQHAARPHCTQQPPQQSSARPAACRTCTAEPRQPDSARGLALTALTLLPGILGAERTLELLLAPLQGAAAGGAGDWRTMEACVYCVRAIHRCPARIGQPPLRVAMLLLAEGRHEMEKMRAAPHEGTLATLGH